MTRYDDELLGSLRRYYANDAARRDRWEKTDWKTAEREVFLERLKVENRPTLLEIGAGTGQDSLFFQEQGIDVVATDLSPAMVERCRAKGLDARVMDFLHLDFEPARFDAAWALNCLLHVPNTDLPAALAAIDLVLAPGALFFVGVYGGLSEEGPRGSGRFFSSRTDDELLGYLRDVFDVVDFHAIDLAQDEYHFQAATLRARVDKPPSERVS